MKSFIIFCLLLFVSAVISPVAAIYNPLSVPNNKYGVHILSPSELQSAAKLVNSSGGEWGYVTIPIRNDDRDREKWVAFFQETRRLKVVPLVRLTTYVQDGMWATPTAYDLVDFANFLNEMPWPTANRYIILFNEPNHSKEWGGSVDPAAYAHLLVDANHIFKQRSSDFFLLTGGMDMSAPTNRTSLDALEYYRRMTKALPNWAHAVDGYSFHAYPNPGFTASPLSKTRYGPRSYDFEKRLFTSLGFPQKPVFITETGSLSTNDFYHQAFTQVWTDSDIVAITPFLLFAGSSDFAGFSLLDINHQPKNSYLSIFKLPKTAGSPLLNDSFFTPPSYQPSLSPQFSKTLDLSTVKPFSSYFSRIIDLFSSKSEDDYIFIGSTQIKVEILRTPREQAKGLSGRASLPQDQGVLFPFTVPGIQNFWMNDMRFALDFIWYKDGKVVHLEENVPPPSQTYGIPKVISSQTAVDGVIEVNAGFISRHNIKIEDLVTLP